MSVNLLEAASAGADKIGRYFTVVSALPTTLFVLYVFVLVRAEGWRGPPDWSSVTHPSAVQVVLLVVISFAMAFATHAIQFPMIQALEGYWGTTRLARRLATIRIMYHRHRFQTLSDDEDPGAGVASTTDEPLDASNVAWRDVEAAFARDEAIRALGSYPTRQSLMMPTLLGNVLRRYETTVGTIYNINPIEAVPRIAAVADEREVAYMRDQRMQLDLAVRTTALAGTAALLTPPLMWRAGLWMLIALIPYAATWLAYRGAVAAAHDYGFSVAVLVDVGRFALYDRMRLKPARSLLAERRTNHELMKVLDREEFAELTYTEPPPVVPTTDPAATAPDD